jgi:hypothetical protein
VPLANGEHCWTPPALAKRWRCRPETVVAMIQRGQLRAFNLGRRTRPRYRIAPEAVAEFEQGRAMQPATITRRRQRGGDNGIIKFF